MSEYKNRIIDNVLKFKLKSKGAVLIEGAKWSGKTTTAAQQAKSILTIDDPINKDQYLQLSQINPSLLLEGDNPRLLDEWQFAPTLWDTVRFEVDHREEMGHFILTGSQVPIDKKQIFHTGTGRFTWLKMRPMSLYESGESSGEVSLKELFNGNLNISGINNVDLKKLAFLVCRGGWPQAINLPPELALRQSFDYVEEIVKEDINNACNKKRNGDRVRRIMRAFARNQGKQIGNIGIVNDIIKNEEKSDSIDSVNSYIEALNNIFVIEDMHSWSPSLRTKAFIRSSNTRYYVDPSIATASLKMGPEDLINDLKTFSSFFKTMCVRDLRVFAESLYGQVYHYKDNTNLECDAIIELRNGSYGLIEIKLGGDDLIEEGAKNLKRLQDKINTTKMKSPSFLMVLIGVGKYAYRREDGVLVVPLGCLKN